MKFVKFLTVLLVLLCAGCTTDADGDDFDAGKVCPISKRGVFTDDRDGRVYKYTAIGNQVWMAENLKKSMVDEPDGEYFDRGLAFVSCPQGWHLPSLDEWNVLFSRLGGDDIAGFRLKKSDGWVPLNQGDNGNGQDDCGFSLLPRYIGDAEDYGVKSTLWTSDRESTGNYVYILVTTYSNSVTERSDFPEHTKFVRCIKD